MWIAFGRQTFGTQAELSKVVPGVVNAYNKAFLSPLYLYSPLIMLLVGSNLEESIFMADDFWGIFS